MRFLFVIVGIVVFSLGGRAQSNAIDSLRQKFDENYGLDVLLYNGTKEYPYYLGHDGHPFWNDDKPFSATVVINGERFNNQHLLYNIERQKFILHYADYHGGEHRLILNSGAIDTIYVGEKVFIPNYNPAIKQSFVQLLFEADIVCCKSWSKDLQVSKNAVSTTGFKYKKQHEYYYVIVQKKVHRFYSKRSFLLGFDKQYRNDIKKYIASKNIRFKDISDKKLTNLVAYCNSLI